MSMMSAVAVALLATTPLFAASFSARVIGIADGDTIRVLHDGVVLRVRLWGIDCPERHQAFGTRAKQFTSNRAFGATVTVHVKDVDRYGRTVAIITLPDGKTLNYELVHAGLAWWYRDYAKNDTILPQFEAEARAAKRGLWLDPHPIPPWEFRKIAKDQRQGRRREAMIR
jgi:endonuclease YncB( thermonuclease family)